MVSKELILLIKNKLKEIEARYKEHYNAVIFNIKIKSVNNNIVLEGIVLSERQKKEAFFAAQKILKNIKIKNEIKVLAEPKEKLEIGWGIIEGSIVDIWGIFPGKKKNYDKDSAIYGERSQAIYGECSRATQAVKGDIVRILAKKGNYYLVQTRDLAIGWADKASIKYQVLGIKYKTIRKNWLSGNKRMTKCGETMKIELTAKIRNKFISFMQNYLYVPYVWGGTTELGIDCSGLVQKFYWEIFGVLLPRHSADQAGYGEKVSLEKAQFGDLVFLREKTRKYSHIGIVVEENQKSIRRPADKNPKKGNILILNARREKNGVVIEGAGDLIKNYNLISIKRIINFN